MRIGVFYRTNEIRPLAALVDWAAGLEAEGFSSAWLPQSMGYDALTALAVIGGEVGRIELGTAVVPTYPRHPAMLAIQALTTQVATGGRLTLGIGLSHKSFIETSFGYAYDRPARHMREYLSALLPLAREGKVSYQGQTITAEISTNIPDRSDFPVLLAAMAPKMLELAGGVADGTITWMTGPKTVENYIVPAITAAAARAGRVVPRVVVALPVCVNDDTSAARNEAAEAFVGYDQAPSYRAMLDRENAAGPAEVAIVGDEETVARQLRNLEAVGATDFVAIAFGNDVARARTRELLASLVPR
jgi:F420-dependent oxidoreductase-like protein